MASDVELVLADIMQAVKVLRSAAEEAAHLIKNEDTSLDDSCELAMSFSAAKLETKEIYESLSQHVLDKMGNLSEHTLGDGTLIERRQSSSRKKWDHLGLVRTVNDKLKQMSVDMDTGEVLLNSQDIAVRMLEYVAPSYWRVKKLSEIGINADMYCEVTEGGINLVIRTKGAKDNDEQ